MQCIGVATEVLPTIAVRLMDRKEVDSQREVDGRRDIWIAKRRKGGLRLLEFQA